MNEQQKAAAMNELKSRIALLLVAIENECVGMGLTTITNITLIARDPDNDKKIILLSNETPEEMRKAFRVAEAL